ncbi:MAG: 16S rRNA (guanine(966)-N(2))-methyltransferase RsmD [Oscillospiraceae bacterium]|nr:16S rRNA (guanine(966)-N(2))-methyltransferase RsmD [Oscillospiraceae bacterium]MBQ2998153.1 16S rRNA (guanine(966)-N(2))-methyltransferase RsmD [Oscillospiraceae bacterium]MBQ3236422.1 16S rRNA (guanine(966)-N(2))-methyltransferase RsmD [Oscillospiraceae bacterium]MBQ3561603.1 16S rRNA (guanine(966)-N(2))-methyltransferase RsmD [Oscillospiraceae bacterium]MBQ4117369.1 16S rRNA (guanine(966)-N(2))-methyltransferase RsmD [Oscillospiraceae bacterium]
MRVITGSAKGKRLVTPEGREVTRPTGEKVKEGIFSSIQFLIEGADVLDLFAGSGQLGIEALSRGARSCVFVDSAKVAQKCITDNLKNCGFTDIAKLKTGDALMYLSSAFERFDIAFLDPPYAAEQLPVVLPALSKVMRPGGVVLCETAKNIDLPEEIGKLVKAKEYRYGSTKVLMYKCGED